MDPLFDRTRALLCARIWLLWAVCLLGLSPLVKAQRGSPAASQGLHGTFLLHAIHSAAPSKETVLAVSADKVPMPPGAVPAPPGQPLSATVAPFGYLTRQFGAVVAVAPQTMIVLPNRLGEPNIYADIPPREAFVLLMASLTENQRQMIYSERGIGQGDLSTPMQRGLFSTLFLSQHLPVVPRHAPGEAPQGGDPPRDISNPMQSGRLRIAMSLSMIVHTPGSEIGGATPVFSSDKGPRTYEVANQNHLFHANTVDGVQVRFKDANVLKSGQLDFDTGALQKRIALNDLKTVGDLIARIAERTQLELYADRRYEGRALNLMQTTTSAKASDLLRALCLCVTGTFRKVGPAYVLTDDVAGVGTRRQRIYDLQADADAQRQAPLQQAEDFLQKDATLWKTKPSGFGDPLLPTDEQWNNKDNNTHTAQSLALINLPFGQLTAPQQQALQGYSNWLTELHDADPNRGAQGGVDFTKNVYLDVQPSLQLLLPDLDGPLDTGLGQFVAEYFQDMSKWRPRYRPQNDNNDVKPAQDQPSIADLGKDIPRRALLAAPRSIDEVDNTVAKMKKMRLNQLWLVVFSKGLASIPGTPFPVAEPGLPDLLDHALKITNGTDIRVYPVIDLFTWGAKVRPNLTDLTITGETSAQDAAHRRSRTALLSAANGNPPPAPASRSLVVSPLAPSAPKDLAALVKTAAQYPGIAGMVCRETCPPGYDMPNRVSHIEPHGHLGYTEAARLAFLRASHADPIDVLPQRGFSEQFERADTSLPQFDGYGIDQLLDSEWKKYCSQANLDVMNALYASAVAGFAVGQKGAATTSASPPVIFVRERRDNFGATWYGAWKGPGTPLPTNHFPFEDSEPGQEPPQAGDAFEQARSQSEVNLVRLPCGSNLEEAVLRQKWAHALKDLAANKHWDGFVFELEPVQP